VAIVSSRCRFHQVHGRMAPVRRPVRPACGQSPFESPRSSTHQTAGAIHYISGLILTTSDIALLIAPPCDHQSHFRQDPGARRRPQTNTTAGRQVRDARVGRCPTFNSTPPSCSRAPSQRVPNLFSGGSWCMQCVHSPTAVRDKYSEIPAQSIDAGYGGRAAALMSSAQPSACPTLRAGRPRLFQHDKPGTRVMVVGMASR
jgi:hypothetical protein